MHYWTPVETYQELKSITQNSLEIDTCTMIHTTIAPYNDKTHISLKSPK